MEVTCPTCRAVVVWEENRFRPFCSERCRLLDLGSWLREDYTIEADEAEDTFEDEPE